MEYKISEQLNNRDSRKEDIKDIGKKRMMTIAVGTLDILENQIGFLWGHKKRGNISEDEAKLLLLWQNVRNNILALGHNQMDDFNCEIDELDLVIK